MPFDRERGSKMRETKKRMFAKQDEATISQKFQMEVS